MRTTLTLDPDVAQKAKALTKKLDRPFKQVINEALRAGLERLQRPLEQRPYRTRSRPLHLREGLQLDNIQDALSEAEGEDAR